jgi:beta-lactamase class D
MTILIWCGKAVVSALSVALLSMSALATTWMEIEAAPALFERYGVSGSFIVLDVNKDRYHVHDQEKASEAVLPASTYKIPHSLIALQLGVVSSVDEILPYGGKHQRLPQWEKDMSLREAITMSNVPVYQGVAKKIGLTAMRRSLKQLEYGNQQVGNDVERFWLDGPLAISPREHLDFLARLAAKTLPIKEKHQQAVIDILLIESSADYRLYAKTGWADSSEPDVGWWVGWVEKGDAHYVFALLIDIHKDADAKVRKPLGEALLKSLNIVPQ